MRTIIGRAVSGLLVCAALGVIAGCGSSSSSSSSSAGSGSSATATNATATNASASSAGTKPISVLWIGDTTGPTKGSGQAQLAGLKAAAEYFNANGGVDGHHVNITAVSDNGDGATGVTEVLQHLSSSTPTMLIPGSEAGDIAAMIPVVAKHKVFAMDINDGKLQCIKDAQTACPNMFVQATPSTTSQIAAANWFKSKGFKKVGILEEQIDFTESETPAFLAALKSEGIQQSTVTFPATSIDLTPQMQELKSDGVDAVYVEDYGPAGGYALKARASLGWTVPTAFDIAASSVDITKLAPTSDDKNAYELTFWSTPASVKNAATETLLKYGPTFGPVDITPLGVSALGWDDLVNLGAALKTDGNSFDVDALDNAMLHIPPVAPLRLYTHKLGYTQSDHEDVLGAPDDFAIVPLGPIVNAQVQ